MNKLPKKKAEVLISWIIKARQFFYLLRIDRAFNKAFHHWTMADIYKAAADSLIDEYNFLFPDDRIEVNEK